MTRDYLTKSTLNDKYQTNKEYAENSQNKQIAFYLYLAIFSKIYYY
jgi:hypothetical protein